MKILFLNYEFPPLGGGAGNANYYLFKEFAKLPDLQIDLVTSSADKYYEQQFAPNIKIYFLDIGKKNKNLRHQKIINFLNYSLQTYFFAKKLSKQNNYDLVHSFFGIPCGYVAFKLNLPYIISLRGFDVPNHVPNLNKFYFLLKPIVKKTWYNAVKIIATSNNLRIRSSQFLPLNYEVINNGIDTDYFKPLNKKGGAFHVIFVGRLHEIKNLNLLVESWLIFMKKNKTANAQLTIIGEGPEYNNIKKMVNHLKINNIFFTGHLPKTEVLYYYQQANVFVLPSKNEGMSNSLLEAMASGLPVIATATGDSEELIDSPQSMIVRNDPLEIYKALQDLYQNPCKQIAIGKNNRQKILQNTWQNVAMQYLTIYNSITK